MEYYIAVFKSRTEALYYANNLKRNQIHAFLIPTPKEVGRTCGLSVKIDVNYFDEANFILSRLRPTSFVGWYRYREDNGQKIIVRG